MDDQRAVLLPLSNNHNKSSTLRPITAVPVITTPTASETKSFFNESASKTLPNNEFFSLLNRLQSRHHQQTYSFLSSTIDVPLPEGTE